MVEVILEVSLEDCVGALQVGDRPIPAEDNAAFWNPVDCAQETVP